MTSYPYPPHILVRAAILQEPGKIPMRSQALVVIPPPDRHIPAPQMPIRFQLFQIFLLKTSTLGRNGILPCPAVGVLPLRFISAPRSAINGPLLRIPRWSSVLRPPSAVLPHPPRIPRPSRSSVLRPFPLTISSVQRIIISIYIELIR